MPIPSSLEPLNCYRRQAALVHSTILHRPYVAFLQSKERAGIERAVLSSVFVADYFPEGFFNRFQSLMVTQDTYLNVFRSLATQEQLTFLDETLTGRGITETERMRKVAVDRANQGSFGIDPAYWFQMQTEKIKSSQSRGEQALRRYPCPSHRVYGSGVIASNDRLCHHIFLHRPGADVRFFRL